MKRKNKRLFVILGLVLVANLCFVFLPNKGSQLNYNESMFTVMDTASISNIRFFNDVSTVELAKTEDGWELNGRYPVDEGLRRLLFSILQRVRVKRPVNEQVKSGMIIDINGEQFSVSGNATKTKTFFTKGDQSYEVEIPGYRDYLANIFELNLDQWRDRLVYNGSWRTIQNLKLDYPQSDEYDFDIRFNEQFFAVGGVERIDSSAVIDYLNQFQYLQANERVSPGRFPKYDSLAQTQPLAILTLESINYSAPEVLMIYPALDNERFHLVKNIANEMVIFDQKRVIIL
jgi:hypothetical protein